MPTGWVSVRQNAKLWLDLSIPVAAYAELRKLWDGQELAVFSATMAGNTLQLSVGVAKVGSYAKGQWRFVVHAQQPTRARVSLPAHKVKEFRGWGLCSCSEASFAVDAKGRVVTFAYPTEPRMPIKRARMRGGAAVAVAEPPLKRDTRGDNPAPHTLPKQPIVIELLGVLYSGDVELTDAFATIVGLGLKPASTSATRPG